MDVIAQERQYCPQPIPITWRCKVFHRPLVPAAFLGAALLGCAGDSAGPAGTGRLTLQLAGRSSATAAPTYTAGADVITITGVQIVARKIQLERASGTCPAESPTAGPQAGEDNDHGDKDCAKVHLAPMLLNPPVDAITAAAVITVDLPEGTYKELKIQIHKPTGSSADQAFLTANPGFADISLKVTGTFNGTQFTFTSAITAEVELELPKPVTVAAGAPTAMTIQIDLSTWFAATVGGLLSPIAPSQQVRSQIEQNIRASFHAFEDRDHDGHAD